VVTKRTKNLKKQEIPSLDDPISKLNHIGKETVKKLNELKASADEAQLELKISKDLHKCVSQLTFELTIGKAAQSSIDDCVQRICGVSKPTARRGIRRDLCFKPVFLAFQGAFSFCKNLRTDWHPMFGATEGVDVGNELHKGECRV
jgi:hypothetical protein